MRAMLFNGTGIVEIIGNIYDNKDLLEGKE